MTPLGGKIIWTEKRGRWGCRAYHFQFNWTFLPKMSESVKKNKTCRIIKMDAVEKATTFPFHFSCSNQTRSRLWLAYSYSNYQANAADFISAHSFGAFKIDDKSPTTACSSFLDGFPVWTLWVMLKVTWVRSVSCTVVIVSSPFGALCSVAYVYIVAYRVA